MTQFEKTFGDDLRKATRAQTYSKPRDMLQAIRETILFDQVTFGISRRDEKGQDQKLERVLVPGWEPVATIFIDNDREWAIWTLGGYYNSSLHGDQLFGWLVNPKDRTGTPRYFSAKQVRKEFDQPDVLRSLFADTQTPPPPPPPGTVPIPGEKAREHLSRISQSIPQVQITSPSNLASAVHEKPVTVTAEVTYSGNPDNYQVKAHLNGAPQSPTQVEPLANGVHRYKWEVPPTEVQNQFRIRVDRKDQKRHEALHQEAFANISAVPPKRNKPAMVHLVGIAVDDYEFPELDLRLACL